MLLKECAKCKKLIPYGTPYCSDCQLIVDAYREKCKKEAIARAQAKYNRKRDPKYIAFYHSKPWRILSAKFSQDKHFRCEKCGALATQVHHKVPIQTQKGWDRRLDYHNLELLCTDCHNKEHHRFQKSKTAKKGVFATKTSPCAVSPKIEHTFEPSPNP